MALGTKTKVGIEKGDLVISNSFTAIELHTQASASSNVFDNVYKGDELGFYTGKTINSFHEVVPINSLNADGSPNFNGTKYYFDSVFPFKPTANPNYNYNGGGFSFEKATGILGSVLTTLGGILGVINAGKTGTDSPTDTGTATTGGNKPTVTPEPEQTWLQKNWLYLTGGLLALLGISGVVYYATKDNDKDKAKKK